MNHEDRPHSLWEIIAQSERLANLFESFEPPTDQPPIIVHKAAYYMPVSVEMAMDHGLMTEEEARAQGWVPPPPVPPPSWRTRIRWRVWELRERLAVRLYRILAGRDIPGDDD